MLALPLTLVVILRGDVEVVRAREELGRSTLRSSAFTQFLILVLLLSYCLLSEVIGRTILVLL